LMNSQTVISAAGGKGRVRIHLAALVALAIVATIGSGTVGCGRPGPGTAKSPEELLTQLKEDRSEIDQTTDTMMKRIDTFNSSRKPGERTLQFSEIFTPD